MARCYFFFQAEDGIRDGHVTGVQTCALPIFESVGRSGLGSASVRIPMGDRRQHLNVNEGVHKYARGYLLCADAVLLSGSNPLQKWQARRVRNSKTKFGTFGTRSRAVRGIWKALRTSRPLRRTRALATSWNPTYHSLPNFP